VIPMQPPHSHTPSDSTPHPETTTPSHRRKPPAHPPNEHDSRDDSTTTTRLIADGGRPTRTCEDCGLTSRRRDLTPTADGYLVCPGCGRVIEAYTGIDLTDPSAYVLRLGTNRSNTHIYHYPDSENPVAPRCPSAYRDAAVYRPTTQDRLSEKYTRCKRCTNPTPADDERPQHATRSTTVWYSQTGDVYHADAGGIPACPEVIPHATEHTLGEAHRHGKRPCKDCQPLQPPEDTETDPSARSTTLGDFA